MRCEEVRQFISAYLDSELDTKNNLQVEEHLEQCAQCRSAYEAQYKFEHNIRQHLTSDKSTQEAWQRALHKLKTRPSPRLRILQAAGLTVILLVLAVFGVYRWNASHQDLSRFAVISHERFVADQLPLVIHSSSAEEIENYFKDKLSFELEIPQTLPFKGARLAGARMCHLNKVPVAYLVYYIDNKPVSVFLMHEEEAVRFRQVRDKDLQIPENMKYHRIGDKLVMTCKAKKAILTALGQVDEPTLHQLALAYE